MKAVLGFILGFMLVTFGWWLVGINFDKRGFDMLAWFIMATYFGIIFCLSVINND